MPSRCGSAVRQERGGLGMVCQSDSWHSKALMASSCASATPPQLMKLMIVPVLALFSCHEAYP